MEIPISPNITEPLTSPTKLQDEVHPSIHRLRENSVTHQNGDNMKRVHNGFRGFPGDTEEAGRGRLHGDFIKSQLDTFIHSPTDNRDDSVFKILTVVSTNNPGVRNVKADPDLNALRLVKPQTDRIGFLNGYGCNGSLYEPRVSRGHFPKCLDTNLHPTGDRIKEIRNLGDSHPHIQMVGLLKEMGIIKEMIQ